LPGSARPAGAMGKAPTAWTTLKDFKALGAEI
jgi:hypothetical protein